MKGILKGWDVIQRGAQRRIRNGKKVKIWKHQWLTRKHSPLVCSLMVPSMEEATADLLIKESTRQWKKDIVDGIFAPKKVELICKIPLSKDASKDTIFWPLTQDGNYTSKTGYRFLKEEAK